MAFRVRLMPRVADDIEQIYRHVIREAPIRGQEWYNRLIRSLDSLGTLKDARLLRAFLLRDAKCGSYCTDGTRTLTGSTSTLSAIRSESCTSGTGRAASQGLGT